MKVKIKWQHNGFTQVKELVNYCVSDKEAGTYFTMNSPIFNAIIDGTFTIDLGYGQYKFEIVS